MRSQRPPLGKRKKFAFALLTSILVLLALEGLCRLTEGQPKTRPSDLLGYEPNPGWRGRKARVNSLGLRGAEVRERTPETFRVLAVGGSTTWGHQLADDETWPFALEEELRRRGLGGAEVLNGGCSGWGLEQLVLVLENRYLPVLAPDLVLVFSGWNYPILEGNPDVAVFRQAAAASSERNRLLSFAIARWLHRRLRSLAPDLMPEDELRARQDLVVRDRQAVMEEEFPGLCRRLRTLSERFEVPVVMIAYPGLADLLPSADDPIYEPFAERFRGRAPSKEEIPALFRGARRILEHDLGVVRESAKEAGVPVIEASARMQGRLGSLPPEERPRVWLSCFMDYMHLTEEGNRALALAIAEELATGGYLP